MAIPQGVLAAGWVPFVIVLLLTLIFSFFYIRHFQHRYDSEVSSTIVSILGMVVAMLTLALIPVDIFLVSYMKTSNGTFKTWATDENRKNIESSVLYAYYALYACVMFFMFLVLPFTYFFYEEGGEDEAVSTKSRCCSALKFTIVFVIVAGVLMVVGAFAPVKTIPSKNSTEFQKIAFLFKELGSNNGEDAVSFCISTLTLIGMLLLVIYTGYGMTAWPIDLVKGRRSIRTEMEEVKSSRTEIQNEIRIIRGRSGQRRISAKDQRRIDELEEKEDFLLRQERHLTTAQKSWHRKCGKLLRPFQIVLGILCFVLVLLVFVSLLMTNIDKVMHSLGWRFGYALPKKTLLNPIDITLAYAQKVFPVDYILVVILVMYFIFCSMGGIQHLGICCFCVRMYKIRPKRTKPQGLLFLCFIMMFIVLALNVVIYQLTPQYSLYGSQQYWAVNSTSQSSHKPVLTPCSPVAPPSECVMTQMGTLLTRFFYKVWFFGACYFYASWAFLGVMVLGFIVAVIRKRRSSIDGEVDRDDFNDSDEEFLHQ